MFGCDLEGDQHLQIWYITLDVMFQSESDDFPLSPAQARALIQGREGQNAYKYWAAFPHSPYSEKALMQDWLRLNRSEWQKAILSWDTDY